MSLEDSGRVDGLHTPEARLALEQTDNLQVETDWPVSFQVRLSFVRISSGDDVVRFLKFGEGTFAPLRTVRISKQVCSAGQKPRF